MSTFKEFAEWAASDSDSLKELSNKTVGHILKRDAVESVQQKVPNENKVSKPEDKSADDALNRFGDSKKTTHDHVIKYKVKNDIVVGLEITCKCGELIEVDFEYPENSSE